MKNRLTATKIHRIIFKNRSASLQEKFRVYVREKIFHISYLFLHSKKQHLAKKVGYSFHMLDYSNFSTKDSLNTNLKINMNKHENSF